MRQQFLTPRGSSRGRSPFVGTGAERPRYCHDAPVKQYAFLACRSRRGEAARAAASCPAYVLFRRDARVEGGPGAPRAAPGSVARCARPWCLAEDTCAQLPLPLQPLQCDQSPSLSQPAPFAVPSTVRSCPSLFTAPPSLCSPSCVTVPFPFHSTTLPLQPLPCDHYPSLSTARPSLGSPSRVIAPLPFPGTPLPLQPKRSSITIHCAHVCPCWHARNNAQMQQRDQS